MAFNFPNSPTVDQMSHGYRWDGEKWLFVSVVTSFVGPVGLLLAMMGVRNG